MARCRAAVLLAVVLAALLATACGDDSGPTSAPVPTTVVAPATGPAPTVADPPRTSTTRSPRTAYAVPGVPLVDAPAAVAPPAGARAAAEVLGTVERALRDPATPAAAVPSLAWHQQAAYRALAAHDEWLAEVYADVPADVAVVIERNLGAASKLRTLVDPPPALPTGWRIVPPRPVGELLGYYREAEAASGIPWQYLAAINLVETRMGRIVGDSTAGAQGPMQFIPSTWEAYGEGGDVHDPHDAVLAAGRYLAAAGGPADMRAALYAYNHSDAYVDAVTGYAQNMIDDPDAFRGYYHWQVTYRTVDGLYLLPEGYPEVPAVRIG